MADSSDSAYRQLFPSVPDPLRSYDHVKFVKLPPDKLPAHLMMSSPNLQRLLFWPSLVMSDVNDLINSYPDITQEMSQMILNEHSRRPLMLTARPLDCDFLPSLVVRLPGSNIATLSQDYPEEAIDFDDIDEFRVSRNSCESLLTLTSRNPTCSTHMLARNFRRALQVAIDMGRRVEENSHTSPRGSVQEQGLGGSTRSSNERGSLVSPNSPPEVPRVRTTPADWTESHNTHPTRPRRGKRERDHRQDTSSLNSSRRRIESGNNAQARVGVVEGYLCAETTPTETPTEPRPICHNQMPLKKTKPSSSARNKSSAKDNETKSLADEGGSRLVLNKTSAITGGPNTRTCLLDALMVFVPSYADTESIRNSLVAAMPRTGDTPVSVARQVLMNFGFDLKVATKDYDNKKGGMTYHLLQERACKLILRIKLTNKSRQSSSHFVAWDGHTIHDRPYSSKVSDYIDRKSSDNSKEVFSKLYRKFADWRITRVYAFVENRGPGLQH